MFGENVDGPGEYFAPHLLAYIPLIVVATAIVALRVFVKLRYVRNIGPEDYAVLFALACAINSTVFYSREAYLSADGYDLSLVDLEKLSARLQCVYAGNITYSLSLTFTKLSFLLQYFRIFHLKRIRYAIWITFFIIAVYGGWTFFSSVFVCWPIDSFWALNKQRSIRDCFRPKTIYVAQGGLNFGTDVIILLLPLPGLKRLQLPRAQKVGLILVFLLGGFICVASLLRMFALIRAFDQIMKMEWGGISIGIWTAVEMNVAIMCCCLPPLRPLVARLWTRMRKSDFSRHISRSRVYLSALSPSRSIRSWGSSMVRSEKSEQDGVQGVVGSNHGGTGFSSDAEKGPDAHAYAYGHGQSDVHRIASNGDDKAHGYLSTTEKPAEWPRDAKRSSRFSVTGNVRRNTLSWFTTSRTRYEDGDYGDDDWGLGPLRPGSYDKDDFPKSPV